jgi:hypothetical protein
MHMGKLCMRLAHDLIAGISSMHACMWGIPGHVVGPGRVGPGQQKARLQNLLPRPGLARLSGLIFLPKPGPSGQNSVGPSGCRAGPSLISHFSLPKPGPLLLSGLKFLPRPGPIACFGPTGRAIFGPGRAGPVGPGFPCPGLVRQVYNIVEWSGKMHGPS